MTYCTYKSMTVASILQCLSVSHVVKKNVLSLYRMNHEKFTAIYTGIPYIQVARGVWTSIFLRALPHHCVRIPANSKTFNLNFQDQNHFLGL